jgi:hypothetical protein
MPEKTLREDIRTREDEPVAALKKKDWTLLVISSAGRPVSPIQLQKSLFLLGQSLPEIVGSNFYRFEPYNYGPFNRTIYSDAETLAAEGLIEISRNPMQDWPEYRVSTTGLQRTEELKRQLDQETVVYVENLVRWVTAQSFPNLLREIYSKFPAFAVNSVFKVEP